MVRQIRQDLPSDYPSPPGGNLGGLAKHIFDLAIPDIEFSENDIFSPVGSYETETSGDECSRITKIYFVRRGLFNINNTIKTLISTFVWRNPECKPKFKYPKPEIEEWEQPINTDRIEGFLCVYITESLQKYVPQNNSKDLITNEFFHQISLIECPYKGNYILSNGHKPYVYVKGSFNGTTTSIQTGLISKAQFTYDYYSYGGFSDFIKDDGTYIDNLGSGAGTPNPLILQFNPKLPMISGFFYLPDRDVPIARTIGIPFGYIYVDAEQGIHATKEEGTRSGAISVKNSIDGFAINAFSRVILQVHGGDPLPPPPPKDECCKNMSCCPKNDNLEQLLRLILKRIGTPKEITIFDEDMDREGTQQAKKKPQTLFENHKLTTERVEIANRLIGIENYPVEVPETMIEPYKEGLFAEVFSFIQGEKKRKIKTLTELLAWQIEQDSATTGQFHQVFEFEIKEGEKETVVIPNIAEALKETIILNSQMARQVNILVEVAFRALTEIVQTKTQVCRNVSITQDIQDYLDYPTVERSEEIKVGINLPNYVAGSDIKKDNPSPQDTQRGKDNEEDYVNYLKEGKARFQYEDWTGENSFHDQIIDLLQVASMLRAILYQRVDQPIPTDNGETTT